MTFPTATLLSSGQQQDTGSSIGSGVAGALTVAAGKLACILFASSRSDTSTHDCKITSLTASGLTFTQVFDEQIEFNVGSTYPLTNWHVQLYTAPVASTVSSLAWSTTMSDGYVNEQIAILFTVDGLTDITAPFDGVVAPGSAVHYTSSQLTSAVYSHGSVNLSTSSTNDLLMSIFLDGQRVSEGDVPPTVAAGTGQTQLANVASNRTASGGNLFVQTKTAASPVSAQAQSTGFNSEYQLNIALAFTGGTTPSVNALVTADAAEVISSGPGSRAIVTAGAVEVLSTGDGSAALLSTHAIEVLSSTAVPPDRAVDGGRIYEFEFTFQPETVYSEADYHSIYSVGDRIGNGLISTVQRGWASANSPDALIDDNWGLAAGNGFGVGASTGWPLGAYLGFEINGFQKYLVVSGFRFQGDAHASPGWWGIYGGYDWYPWSKITAEFDQFNLNIGSVDPVGGDVCQIEFTPPFLPFNFFMINLDDADTSGPNFAGANFGAEVLLKVYHSILDGGDRRSSNGRPAKQLTISVSGGIVADAGALDPFQNLLDGQYFHSNSGSRSKIGATTFARVGGAYPDDAVTAPGEYIQFSFPRSVFMREMVWCASQPETYTGSDPTKYGTWQWYGSNSPSSGFVAVGDPWHFEVSPSSWIVAPAVLNENFLPPTEVFGSNLLYTGSVDSYKYPYWRMVLVSGPAFGSGLYFGQVQFNLIDPDGQGPLLEAAFSDDDADAASGTLTVTNPTGGSFGASFTDGSDDIMTAVASITNNFVLTAAFSDDAADALSAFGSFYPAFYAQVMVNVKGK